MAFLGYYMTTDNTLTALANPPTAVDGDEVIGIYHEPGKPFRTAQAFVYNSGWELSGSQMLIQSTNPILLPLDERAANIAEAYGMESFPMQYAFVNSEALQNWGTSNRVGNDAVSEDDLDLRDIATGNPSADSLSVTGLLPVYVKTGDAIVGVGSAMYTGTWRVLWYKMSVSSGLPPSVACDTETILTQNSFKMIGDTTRYTLYLYDENGEAHIIPGVYDKVAQTTYLFSKEGEYDYTNTWRKISLIAPSEYVVYTASNMLKPMIEDTNQELDTFKTATENAITALDTDKIPVDLYGKSDTILCSIEWITRDGTEFQMILHMLNPRTKIVQEYPVILPTATTLQAGLMTSDQVAALNQAGTDISTIKATLESGGGVWIGQDFATHADLIAAAPTLLPTVSVNDFTYVDVDEDHEDARTLYVVVNVGGVKSFMFKRKDSTVFRIATSEFKGVVLSANDDGIGTNDGKINVISSTGEMRLIGYDSIITRLNTLFNQINDPNGLTSQINAIQTTIANKKLDFTTPATGPLSGKNLEQIIAYINDAFQGKTPIAIDIDSMESLV